MRHLLASLLLTGVLVAQAHDERTAPIGMRAHIEELVLPGTELVVKAAKLDPPIVLRVLAVRAHGDRFRYDLEWVAYEAGKHDLRTYLARKDGSSTDDLPAIEVSATGKLGKGVVEPNELDSKSPAALGGYTKLLWVAGILWVVGLLAILFVGRRRKAKVAPPPPKPTLADRLRPLVEQVAGGKADDAQKAELERLLVSFWRERLDLREVKAAAALIAIKQHPEAGTLLRQVEAWLHMPNPPTTFDAAALLAPYRSVAADHFERPARGEAS